VSLQQAGVGSCDPLQKPAPPADNRPMFDINFLLASMVWGTVGAGCLVYGKKQSAAPAIIAGLALVVASAVIHSPLLLSVLSLLCLSGMVWAIRRGF